MGHHLCPPDTYILVESLTVDRVTHRGRDSAILQGGSEGWSRGRTNCFHLGLGCALGED